MIAAGRRRGAGRRRRRRRRVRRRPARAWTAAPSPCPPTRTSSSPRWPPPTRTRWSCSTPPARSLCLADQVGAVVEAWYPGQNSGTALAHVLFGDVNPSGKLPTFPPATSKAGRPTHRRVPRRRHDVYYARACSSATAGTTARQQPLFPFGYGLSYTTSSSATCGHPPPAASSVATVTATHQHRPARAGAEVAQVYVAIPRLRRRAAAPAQGLREGLAAAGADQAGELYARRARLLHVGQRRAGMDDGRRSLPRARRGLLARPATPRFTDRPLVTGVAVVTDRELGRGRRRHQPQCRHRSRAWHKPTHRGPRRRRAERDSRRSPRSGERCTARWWQRARWRATRVGKRRQYNAPRLPHPEQPDVRWPSPAAARQDRRESFALMHGRGSVNGRGGAGPTGPRFLGGFR